MGGEVPTMIHVPLQGRSFDLVERDIGAPRGAADRQVKTAITRYLDMDSRALSRHLVDRPKTGGLVVRLQAIYG